MDSVEIGKGKADGGARAEFHFLSIVNDIIVWNVELIKESAKSLSLDDR